jgi:hypothetical protein
MFRVSQNLESFCNLEKHFVNSRHCPPETGSIGTALQKKAKRGFSLLFRPASACSFIPDAKGFPTFINIPDNKS